MLQNLKMSDSNELGIKYVLREDVNPGLCEFINNTISDYGCSLSGGCIMEDGKCFVGVVYNKCPGVGHGDLAEKLQKVLKPLGVNKVFIS